MAQSCLITAFDFIAGVLSWTTVLPNSGSPGLVCTVAASDSSDYFVAAVVTSSSRQLVAVNASTGATIWSYSTSTLAAGASPYLRPTINPQAHVAALSLYFAVDLTLGLPVWTRSRNLPVITTLPALSVSVHPPTPPTTQPRRPVTDGAAAIASGGKSGALIAVRVDANLNFTVECVDAHMGTTLWLFACPAGQKAVDVVLPLDEVALVICSAMDGSYTPYAYVLDSLNGTVLAGNVVLANTSAILAPTILAIDRNFIVFLYGFNDTSFAHPQLSAISVVSMLERSLAAIDGTSAGALVAELPVPDVLWSVPLPQASVEPVGFVSARGSLGLDGHLQLHAGHVFMELAESL